MNSDCLCPPPKISVIIPMYNVEAYLERCLRSVKEQIFSDFEVLLVDDGSTDCTRSIARRYADADPRFHLIVKPNGGVSSARNAGLAAARGDYLSFIDSDDFVEPGFLEALYSAAAESGADVACCNFNRYFPRSGFRLPHLVTKLPRVYPAERILKSLLHDSAFQSYLWNKLWRRSLFTENRITFPSMLFEDTQAAVQLFYHARQVVILPAVLYNYTQRGDSLVHTLDAKSENDFLRAFARTRRFLELQGVYPEYRLHFRYFTVKSMLFVWGVSFLIHFRKRNFRGFLGNLLRPSRFLAYYGSGRFRPGEPGPEVSGVVCEPPPPRAAAHSRGAA